MSSAAKTQSKDLEGQPVTPCYLTDLRFDLSNPRFGPNVKKFTEEREVLDHIVEAFGVEDLLSSLAVNGYFESEPLVGVRDSSASKIKILEGNRRLAACLILARDPRAKNQKKRQEHYGIINAKHGYKSVNPVPVLVFEGKKAAKDLLPFLGVRHIVGSSDWDSYSKAHWVAEVVKDGDLNLDDVMQMIGDDARQSERMLAAYYLVNQLIDTGRFDPKDSLRKGRGSNAEFPFSLVYNALDHGPIWKWVGFTNSKSALKKNPLHGKGIDNAESLMTFLFGRQSKGIAPAIKDSREISDLARAIADPEQVLALKRGASVGEAVIEALPASERLIEGLGKVRTQLEALVGVIARGTLSASDAADLVQPSAKVRALAQKLNEEILNTANRDDTKS